MKPLTQRHIVLLTLVSAVLLLAACSGAATPAVPGSDLAGKTWKWQHTDFNSGKTIPVVPNPPNYTLQFLVPDGKINFQADCNTGSGSFVITNGTDLTIKVESTTRAACPPDSYSDEYIKELGEVVHYTIERNGDLVLALNSGAGMRFNP